MDLYEEVLPLGSVVELNKEYVKDLVMNIDRIEKIRIVITHRFLFEDGEKAYLNYAGVLYPIGFQDKGNIIHFTSSAIEYVEKKSFQDIEDHAYICFIKNELIVKRGIHSFRFSTQEERESLQRKIG